MSKEILRDHTRIPLEVEVSLESESNFYAGIAGNVSEGGVFVATYTAPPRGSIVEIDLMLAGEREPIRCKGEVRWTRDTAAATPEMPAGCGVQFTEISEGALKTINRFIRARDTILYDDD